ncbi:MAG: HAD-IIIA family hydrolase [Aureliella sp.]
MNLPELRCREVECVLTDVDGVLTDGSLFIGPRGEEFKQFNAKDGVAVALLHHYSIKVGVVSGRKNDALTKRCEDLNMDIIRCGVNDKREALEDVCCHLSLSMRQIAFIGDDIIDAFAMESVGLAIAPSDAHFTASEKAHHTTHAAGGRGVLREAAEFILLSKGITREAMYKPLSGYAPHKSIQQ